MSVPYSRVTGLLSFYDEPVELIAAHVSSLAGVVDHLVAVDGAYALYPGGKPASDPVGMRVITEICRGLRIGLTTHTPATVWLGNEVAKRNHLLRLAEPVTNEDGWYLVLDTDCVVTGVHPEWFQEVERVASEGYGAMSVGVRDPLFTPSPDQFYETEPVRLMYRAVRGLEYGPAHWCLSFIDDDGGRSFMWGPGSLNPCDAYDGRQLLTVEHRHEVTEERDMLQRQYYARRDSLGVENIGQVSIRGLDGRFRARNAGNRTVAGPDPGA